MSRLPHGGILGIDVGLSGALAKRITLEQATADFVRAVDEAVGLDGVHQIVIGRTWLSASILDQSIWNICEFRDEREVGR